MRIEILRSAKLKNDEWKFHSHGDECRISFMPPHYYYDYFNI